MTHESVEPAARHDALTFTAEQVERGRRLVGRDDLLANDKRLTLLELGALLVEVVGRYTEEIEPASNEILEDFTSRIGVGAGEAREYLRVVSGMPDGARDEIAVSGVTVSYSVIREASLGYSLGAETRRQHRALPPEDRDRLRHDRFDTLLRLVAEDGRTRVTAQEYRAAIGARQIPNAASAMSPEKIVAQLGREDVLTAVVEALVEEPVVRKAIAAESKKAAQVDYVRQAAEEGTAKTPAGRVIELPAAVQAEAGRRMELVNTAPAEQSPQEWAADAYESIQRMVREVIDADPEIKAGELRASFHGAMSRMWDTLRKVDSTRLSEYADDDVRDSLQQLRTELDTMAAAIAKPKGGHLRAVQEVSA